MKSRLIYLAPFLQLLASPAVRAQVWTQTGAPYTNWATFACSADGTKILSGLAVYGAYFSSDSGATWAPLPFPPMKPAQPVASSADGKILLAGNSSSAGGTPIIYVSYDGGATWGAVNGWATWLAATANGTKWFAAVPNAPGCGNCGSDFYAITNHGASWNQIHYQSNGPPEVVACSADGRTVVAASYSVAYFHIVTSSLDISTNSGATWWSAGVSNKEWSSVAVSADGGKIVAAAKEDPFYYDSGPGIYLSPDYGVTWTPAAAPVLLWSAVAASADGTRLIAAANPGPVYVSTNSGADWTMAPLPLTNWTCAASSADGALLLAGSSGALPWDLGLIYRSQSIPTPRLQIAPSGPTNILSWLVPSINFVLQQNSNLNPTNWTDVATTPILNFTNLHYEVSVPATNASRFYRLKALLN